MTIRVYTCIATSNDNRDELTRPQPQPHWLYRAGSDCQFYCFTDHLQVPPVPVYRPLSGPALPARRRARWHKLHPFELFPEADVAIWHDGNMWLNSDPFQLVDLALPAGRHVAFFRHPQRNCLFQEWAACVKLRKDDPMVMAEQMSRYRRECMPEQFGLFETGSFLVRNSEPGRRLLELWWQQIATGSCRDQLSLTYVIWKYGLSSIVAVPPGNGNHNGFFGFRRHR